MKSSLISILSAFCNLCLIGCAVSPTPSDQTSTEPIIRDFVDLPAKGATLQDLAFTFPVFEMGAEQTKSSIKRGDALVKTTSDSWFLEGDGAQCPVLLKRLSPEGVTPIIVRLEIRGIEDDPDKIYTYQRIRGGWRLLNG